VELVILSTPSGHRSLLQLIVVLRTDRPHSAACGSDVNQVSGSAVISVCKVCPRYRCANSHRSFSRNEIGCCDLIGLVRLASRVTGQGAVADRHIHFTTCLLIYLKTFIFPLSNILKRTN
jgi:hypothetical protein